MAPRYARAHSELGVCADPVPEGLIRQHQGS